MTPDNRQAQVETFLAGTDWGGTGRVPLNADASFRRYFRLQGGPARALLMDAPPASTAPLQAYLDVAQYLRGQGLSAPKVYAADTANGLAIIEDLGDALFARVVQTQPQREAPLYRAAVDVLVHLHRQPPPALATYDAAAMAEMAAVVTTWYAPGAPLDQADLIATIADLAGRLDPSAFTQRDYHAENLIWLPDRGGLARVGLLDFQDASLAPGAFDLVSLLCDARRDVSPEVASQARAHYIDQRGLDPDAFAYEYALCGAQRALRILGVFARLCLRDAKPGYLPLMPRVWAQLQQHLTHPDLAPLAQVLRHLPAPSAQHLAQIEARR